VKVRYLVNPSAGKGKTGKHWRQMFAGKGLDVRLCDEVGMIEHYTEEAVSQGIKRIVIVGGDGSLNTAINALHGADVEMAIVPTGSGNDFIRTAGIDYAEPECYLEPLSTRRIDLGKVGDRLFVNIFGSGFDADVARGMQQNRWKGDFGYFIEVMKTLSRFKSPRVTMETDSEKLELDAMTVSVGNGRWHGGMFMLTPDADLTDGELDLCLVRKIPKLRFLTLVPTSVKGKHVEITDVVSIHRFKHMKLSFSRPVNYHIDGEVSPEIVEQVEISILPKALSIVVP
jgi:diacylglycerol kinase (ATP)